MADRKPIISGNWKMHQNHFEAIQLVQKLSYALTRDDYKAVDISVHPPFTDIRSVQTLLDADRIPLKLGAQNCHWEEKGAFTGEIAAPMLAKLQVEFVIVGHSERRQLFAESDEDVNRKVKSVLTYGMTPIMACGETLEEREAGQAQDRITSQLRGGLAGVPKVQIAEMVLAYEPIWAIGTGKTASPEDAQTMCAHIRSVISELHDADTAASVRIQYGGSVKPGNAAELMGQPDIDGALVGGAALDAGDFAMIAQYRLAGA